MRLRPVSAAAAVCLLLTSTLAACTTSGSQVSSSNPSNAAGTAKLTDCSDRINIGALGLPSGARDHLSFDCGSISVPLDYAEPNGKKISIAVVRVHDRTATQIGSLLVNPGGPGASGIEAALGLTGQLSSTLLKYFDLVGFDPRGVGSSSPISCLTDKQKDELNAASPDVRTPTGFADAKRTAAATAKDCTSKYGSDIAYYNTVDTARDMDRVRAAVGDKQLNYLGFSYGTELGAQYAHLFPTKVRVAVLDGAVDPLTKDITSFADQLQGFEDAFDQFAAYCRKTTPCSSIGDARSAVSTVAGKATASPLTATGDSRKVTSSLVYTGVLSALYSKSSWPALGSALENAEKGDGKGLLTLADQYNERYDGKYTNISDANLTIGCNDSSPGPSDATIRATTASWQKRFPIFGLWSVPSLFACQQWQPNRTVPPLPSARTTPRKILVIGNLHDPATPYRGAQDLTKTLGNADLLTWDGEGHTSYLKGSSCVDDAVNAYLERGTLPPANTKCPA